MNDPWKYAAFPAAAVGGFLLTYVPSVISTAKTFTGLSPFFAELTVVAISGFIAGFMVDEVIPAYIEKLQDGRGGSPGAGGMDMGGDMDDDFNFD